ncbi:fasciclin domain-containing protein [Roseovarius sp. CAU 1744]|uniref:fasciclin domain-containing protein n=1 Tax=Roseovarius sp. CAU 1744 TaxID=3140368 RepID=UPI00325BCC98
MAKKITLAAALTAIASAAPAGNPMVGGAPMYEQKTIVENAVNSADHTTLVAAVKAADLVDTLNSDGPFTVFAPVNAAFAALPEGTVETLLKPENKAMLQKVLTAHVVAGDWSAKQIAEAARSSADGFYHFNAVSGDALSAQVKGNSVYIYDESGNASKITIADVDQSNGVIHVVNSVLVPK